MNERPTDSGFIYTHTHTHASPVCIVFMARCERFGLYLLTEHKAGPSQSSL